MKSIHEPPINSRQTIESCSNQLRDKRLASRINQSIPTVEAHESVYKQLGEAGCLYQIPSLKGVGNTVSDAEMRSLYKNSLSKKGSSSRHFYDKLRLSAPHGICPLCGQRVVATLDHYLPQSTHSLFSVTPINLVPSCSDCNKLKLDHLANSENQQTLHPYFDNVSSEKWLTVEIHESNPPSVVYKAIPPENWDHALKERIEVHFNTFGLGDLYAAQASSEMSSIRYALLDAAAGSGPEGVRFYLNQQAIARSMSDKNSWIAALYTALSESTWFFSIGYTLIGTGT